MNILNFLPALLFLCTLDQSLHTALRHFAMLVLTQILISLPFTTQYPSSYLHGAFNLHREFLYKWTVNWRFLPQDVFLCPRFWLGLITLHLALLGLFFLRWCAPHGGGKRVIIRTCGGLDLPAALSRQRVDPSCTLFSREPLFFCFL